MVDSLCLADMLHLVARALISRLAPFLRFGAGHMKTTPSLFPTLRRELPKGELLIAAAMSGKTDLVKEIVSQHRSEIPPELMVLSADLAKIGGWKETAKAVK